MRRREFIALLSGLMAADWSSIGACQPAERTRRIAILLGVAETDPEAQSRVGAVRQELERLGWVEGRNLRIEQRWTGGDPERVRAYTAELVASAPDAIIANPTATVVALKLATRTIPIVFVLIVDPVWSGLIESWARPGRNTTGFTSFDASMAGKWLQALQQMAPQVKQVALVFNPETAPWGGLTFVNPVEKAAAAFAVRVVAAPVRNGAELEALGDALAGASSGLLVMPDIYTTNHREEIIALAARRRLPALYPFRFFATSGGLMSYGIDALDVMRRAAGYLDRILRGTNVGELPVQGPTKFELVINLKSVKALGLSIPPSLLALADEVIE